MLRSIVTPVIQVYKNVAWISSREMLDNVGLFSQERKRLRGNIIKLYTIMRGVCRIDGQNVYPRVEMSEQRRRKENLKEMYRASSFYTEIGDTHGYMGNEVTWIT